MALTPEDLFGRLAGLGIETRTVDHAAVFTVEEAQAVRGLMPGLHTKNLFLRDNKKTFFLVTVAEDRPVDLKRLRGLIGARGGLSFGSPEALREHLGVTPGAVTPFAAANDEVGTVTVFLDEALLAGPVVCCHPLVNTRTTAIAPADLVSFLRAVGHEPGILAFADAPAPESAA